MANQSRPDDPCPCLVCIWTQRCADQELACPDYQRYRLTGVTKCEDRNPSHAVYLKIYFRRGRK